MKVTVCLWGRDSSVSFCKPFSFTLQSPCSIKAQTILLCCVYCCLQAPLSCKLIALEVVQVGFEMKIARLEHWVLCCQSLQLFDGLEGKEDICMVAVNCQASVSGKSYQLQLPQTLGRFSYPFGFCSVMWFTRCQSPEHQPAFNQSHQPSQRQVCLVLAWFQLYHKRMFAVLYQHAYIIYVHINRIQTCCKFSIFFCQVSVLFSCQPSWCITATDNLGGIIQKVNGHTVLLDMTLGKSAQSHQNERHPLYSIFQLPMLFSELHHIQYLQFDMFIIM